MGIFHLSALIYLLSVGFAYAGAWTLKAGDTQAILSTAYTFSSDRFDENGKRVVAEELEKVEIRAFTEYGVTDALTAFAQPEWRSKSQGKESVQGLGRVDLGLRQRLWHDEASVVSFQGAARIPGASENGNSLNDGDTEWELDWRLQYGRGFDLFGKHGFLDAQSGYRQRFGAPLDEIHLDITAGIELRDAVLTMVQSFNTVSVGSSRDPFLETREHKVAVSSVYQFSDRWSLQAGGVVTIYGENVSREQGLFAALWAQF